MIYSYDKLTSFNIWAEKLDCPNDCQKLFLRGDIITIVVIYPLTPLVYWSKLAAFLFLQKYTVHLFVACVCFNKELSFGYWQL